MLTTIMKYAAIATLLAGLFWKFVPNARTYLDFVVAAGSVFVLVQAVNLRKYWWVAGFGVVTFLFNPMPYRTLFRNKRGIADSDCGGIRGFAAIVKDQPQADDCFYH